MEGQQETTLLLEKRDLALKKNFDLTQTSVEFNHHQKSQASHSHHTSVAPTLASAEPSETQPLPSEKIESKSIQDLHKFQDQLRQTQTLMLETLKPQNSKDYLQVSLQNELDKITDQLGKERAQNSKLSADLSRSLELNLKLQFEVEEIRVKANQLLKEEQGSNNSLQEKIKKISHEKELSEAVIHDLKSELNKAKDCYQSELEKKTQEIHHLSTQIEKLTHDLNQSERSKKLLEQAIEDLRHDKHGLSSSLDEYKKHAEEQSQVLKTMSELAQAKMLEVQAALHKKSAESRDYQSHLQQVLVQLDILKQENQTLKDYFNKLSNGISYREI
jgi:chromosome segregation ATPase